MPITWKPCRKCKEEVMVLVEGQCHKCAGWEPKKAVSVRPAPIAEKTWKDRRSWEERRQEERRGYEG